MSPRTGEPRSVSLECTLETFVPVQDSRVRWLEQESDFNLVRECWQNARLSITRGDWDDWYNQGYRYCGIVEDHRLIALAAAWVYSRSA